MNIPRPIRVLATVLARPADAVRVAKGMDPKVVRDLGRVEAFNALVATGSSGALLAAHEASVTFGQIPLVAPAAAIAAVAAGQVLGSLLPQRRPLSAPTRDLLAERATGRNFLQRAMDRWTGRGLPHDAKVELAQVHTRNLALGSAGVASLAVGMSGHMPTDVAVLATVIGGKMLSGQVTLRAKALPPEQAQALAAEEDKLLKADVLTDVARPPKKR